MFKTYRVLAATLLSLSCTYPVHAEDDAPANYADNVTIDEIVVTGSRLKRSEFNSPVPVQVIDMELQALEGVIDTADILQNSNLAANAPQLNNFVLGNPATDQYGIAVGGPGTNSLDLRGLGTGKTLVLLNGRRLNPAGTRGTVAAVDLNTIPSSVIERIEILKDGASSVYGSDAVAGVVNIITRTDADGFAGNVSYGAPFDSGGEMVAADLSFGVRGADSSFLFGVEYFERQPLTRGDRNWAQCKENLWSDPETGERLDWIDPTTGEFKCYDTWAHDYVVNYGDYHLTGEQSRSIYDPALGEWRVSEYAERGFDHPSGDLAQLIAPVERLSLFSFGDWRADVLGANTQAYYEVMYNRRRSEQSDGLHHLYPRMEDNPWSPFYNDDGWAIDYPFLMPIIFTPKQEVDWWRGVIGFTGDWTNDWSWDVHASYGHSEGSYGVTWFLKDRVENTVDLVEVGDGVYDCAVNLEPGADGQCVPLNAYAIIRDGLNSPELFPRDILDYITTVTDNSTVYTQATVSGYVNGTLFELPAGNAGVVIGAEARRESIDDVPDSNVLNDNMIHGLPRGITTGTDEVWELFAELELPLVREARAAQDLTLSLAGRYSHYDTAGADTTYRAGLNWQMADWLRVRSSFGTSFRAPALYENFLVGETTGSFVNDPCYEFLDEYSPGHPVYENCWSEIGDAQIQQMMQTRIVTYGNAGRIRPETSESLTAGLVVGFEAIDLAFALDYFEFTIADEIAKFGANTIISQCYNLPPGEFRQPGTICDFVSGRRDFTLIIDEVNDSYFNINQQYQQGIDLTMRFGFDVSSVDFVADLRATKILEHTQDLFEGQTDYFNGTTWCPDVNGQFDLRAMTDAWTLYYGLNYIGGGSDYSHYEIDPEESIWLLHTPGVTYHNLAVGYDGNGWSTQVGVRNVLDTQPPILSGAVTEAGNAASNSSYDRLGRSYFLRISKDFDGS